MKRLLNYLLLTVAVASVTGCRHRLADQPLTPKQKQWAEKMDGWNWKWRLPYNAPVRDRSGTTQATGNGMTEAPVIDDLSVPALPGDLEAPDLPPVVLPMETSSEMYPGGNDLVLVPMDGQTGAVDSPQFHQVRKGDTLYKISLQYYGKSSLWRRIYDANREKIDSPDKLKPGMELSIPPAP